MAEKGFTNVKKWFNANDQMHDPKDVPKNGLASYHFVTEGPLRNAIPGKDAGGTPPILSVLRAVLRSDTGARYVF